MPPNYTLDQKINALNLLDQHDGDFLRVKAQTGIPVKTLRGWHVDQDNLRQQFDDRQYRYFANIKHELLKDMLESSRDIMKKIKSGDHQGIAVSQLAYTVSTLLNNAKQLEEHYEDLAPDAEKQRNRIEYVYDNHVQDAPPWATRNPQEPSPLQSPRLRKTLGQIGTRQNRHPEGSPPRTQTLLVGRPQLQNGEPNLARSRKRRQTPERHRHQPKRTPH